MSSAWRWLWQPREGWQCSGSVSPRVVPVLVFHGSEDPIVIPINAQQTLEQFAQMSDLGDDGIDNDTVVERSGADVFGTRTGGPRLQVE